MKQAFLIFTLLTTGLSHAASLDQEIKKLQNSYDIGTNGGMAEVFEYDMAKFNYKTEVKELLENIQESSCKFTPIIGRKDAAYGITGMDSKAVSLLQKLIKEDKVKAAIGYSWDGNEGDSEYCSRESLRIFFNNGKVLSLDHDSTT